MSEIIDTSKANEEPCVEWDNGELHGSIPHSPLPFSCLAGRVEVGCNNCDKYLYTYEAQ